MASSYRHDLRQDPGGEKIFTVEGSLDGNTKTLDPEASQAAGRKPTAREWVLASIMLALTVACSTAAGQLTNLTLTDPSMNFHAPFLFLMFKIVFRAMAFPLYLVINTIIKVIRGRKLDLRRTCRRGKDICGEESFTFRTIVFKFLPPMILSFMTQIAYILAISTLSASMASALTSPSLAVSYILSWLFLKHRLLFVKVVFVLVTFVGVGLIVFHEFTENFSRQTAMGIGLMLGHDLSLSFHQLAFKKSFPKGHLGQVSFAISTMFGLMALLYWPIPLAVNMTGYEVYDMVTLPWGKLAPILITAWGCAATSSLVYGYGIVLAGGFFMGLSDLIVLVLHSGIDVSLRGVKISNEQIIGTVIIGVAFIMMVLPDDWVSIDLKRRLGRGKKIEKNWEKLAETGSIASQDSLKMKQQRERFRRVRTTTEELLNTYDILDDTDIMALARDGNAPVVPFTTT